MRKAHIKAPFATEKEGATFHKIGRDRRIWIDKTVEEASRHDVVIRGKKTDQEPDSRRRAGGSKAR